MSRDGKVVTMSQESQLTTALAEAAATAGHAPSVHNTQPWRWRVLPDALELRSVADRQLAASDPEGRLLAVSCGAALHHARVALAAEGWHAVVQRLPDPDDSDLLARLTDLQPHQRPTRTPCAWCSACRCGTPTGGRSATSRCRPQRSRTSPGRSAPEGCRLQILDRDQVLELAAAAGHADAVEAEDPELRAELAYWTSRAGSGTGLPPEVLPEQPAQTTVPGRDFGRPGSLPIGPGHDRMAVYAMLLRRRGRTGQLAARR